MPSPQAQAIIDKFLENSMKDVFTVPEVLNGLIEQTRGDNPDDYVLPDYVSEGARVTEARTEDGYRIFVLDPLEGEPSRTLLYFHGGGFLMQIDVPHWAFCLKAVKETGARAIVPIYPLAPTNTVQDMFGCVSSSYKYAQDEGVGPLTVAGDSAGGTLAVCCAQMAVRDGLETPDLLVGVSPWLDIPNDFDQERKDLEDQDVLLGVLGMKVIPEVWCPAEVEAKAFPPCSLYGPIEGMPPTILTYSTTEILKYDAIEMGKKLEAAGVDVEYIVGEGMWHIFPVDGDCPETEEACAKIMARMASL